MWKLLLLPHTTSLSSSRGRSRTRLESERWSKRVAGGIFLWNAFLRAAHSRTGRAPRGDLFFSHFTLLCFAFNEQGTQRLAPNKSPCVCTRAAVPDAIPRVE
jgi:hypothetical protein